MSQKKSWFEKIKENLEKPVIRLVLLKIISDSQDTGVYGYEIGKELTFRTKELLGGTDATFYAILRELEQSRLVKSELKRSTMGPARKYYTLTKEGVRTYEGLLQKWIQYNEIIQEMENKLSEGGKWK
ncbi:MAG: PadR family transcriptional regulator [Candidatus Hodarchaeota archaeon]